MRKNYFSLLTIMVMVLFSFWQANAQYCVPVYATGCTSGDDIDNFVMADAGLEHLGSGCSPGGYGDFTSDPSLVATVLPGETYSFSATHGFGGQFLKIWIDFDGNGSFEDPGELLFTSSSGGTTTVGNIVIPSGVDPITTRMRVMGRWNSAPQDSCTPGGQWGETHDYTVEIGGGVSYCIPVFSTGCTSGDDIDDFIMTDAGLEHLGSGCSPGGYGDFTSDPNLVATVLPGETYSFSATHGFGGQFLKIWIDFDGNGSFEDPGELLFTSSSGGTTTVGNIVIPSGADPITTRMRVMGRWNSAPQDSCTPGGPWGETHDYTVEIGGGVSYCIPVFSTGCTSGDDIDDFIMTDAGLEHLGSGCSPGGYGDFTSDPNLVATVNAGETYDFTATHNFGSQRVKIWIDFDGNGSFEDSGELVYTSPAGANPTVGTVSIPSDVDPITSRMRVMTRWSSLPSDSCDAGGAWGEAHDYTIVIEAGGGGGGDECTFETLSNGVEDGTPNSLYGTANDFIVPADETFMMEQVVVPILTSPGTTILYADLTYFDNSASNLPGVTLGSENGITPTSQDIIGSAFGFDVREVVLDITPFAFAAGATDTNFWVQVHTPNSGGSATYWESNTSGPVLGYPTAGFDGTTWSYTWGANYDGVFQYNGDCSGSGGGGGCEIGQFNSRGDFEAAFGGTLNLEDFAGGPGALVGCDGPINNSGNSCFPAGEILPGISITSSTPDELDPLVFLPAGSFGNTIDMVGSNQFTSFTIIEFPDGNVDSFGFDVQAFLGGGNIDIRIYGATSGLLNTYTINATSQVFFGYIASEILDRVELEDLTGANVELIGNLAFGLCGGGGGDCEPGVMELPFDASYNQFAGNMYDVTAIGGEDVIIEGFDVNIDPGTATIAVYYREGTYVGFENSSAGWTLLGTEVVTSAGENMPTHVEIGGVTIPDGETYGFYVSVTDYDVSGVSMNYTDGNNTFTDSYVEVTLGAGKGSPDFLGATFADRIWNGNIYYCAGEGGGGGDCSSPVVDINQDESNTCMAFISQTGIAQSFTAESSMSAGAGFMFTTTVAAGQTLEVGLWDNLPNAGGVLLTSGSVTTPGGDAWVDVFWDTPASTTIGDMYYLVVEGTVLECMAGTTYDSYPGGHLYANAGYGPFPDWDYTFRHYGCEGGGGGGDCEWEVHVFDNSGNFGDEVSWQLLDGATVLLSGGPYVSTPYDDVQTIMAGDGPLTFTIEAIGTFNDNTPSYTVTAGGTVVASGTLTGGTEAIHEDLMCDGSGGGNDPVGDCDEANERGTTIVDGLNCSANSTYKTANDLTVPADKDFHLEQIRANILSIGNITDVDIYYYDNSGTLPGAQIGSELGIVPSAQNHTGSAFGYDVYEIILDIPTYIFAGQTGSTTTYWIELSVDNTSSSGSIFWELTNENSQGNPAALFDGGWMVWDPTMDGVYLWGGNCVEIISSEEMTISGFSYYPNPASDVIYLQADQIIDSVDLYNVLGQQVLTQSVHGQSSQLDVSGLASGTYLMTVHSEGSLHTYQVIKK